MTPQSSHSRPVCDASAGLKVSHAPRHTLKNTTIVSAVGIILGVTFVILFVLVGTGGIIGFLIWKNSLKMYLVRRRFKLHKGGGRR